MSQKKQKRIKEIEIGDLICLLSDFDDAVKFGVYLGLDDKFEYHRIGMISTHHNYYVDPDDNFVWFPKWYFNPEYHNDTWRYP